MTTSTVTWRQTAAAIAVAVVVLFTVTIVFNSNGLPAVDAATSRATRWFVHRPSGTVVLADGFGGRAVARLDADAEGEQISVVDGIAGVFLLNDFTGEVRPIETAELAFGASSVLAALGDGQAISAIGPAGLTVVNPLDGRAATYPFVGESLSYTVATGDETVVAPDGVSWTIDGPVLHRSTAVSSTGTDLGLGPAASISLVGDEPFVVDRDNLRARLGDGDWQVIDTTVDPSELVVQENGPAAECGWVGADDALWCISTDGIDEQVTVPGLDIEGSDLLAIAGDAGAVVRRGPAELVRFDWRSGEIIDDEEISVAADEPLAVTASNDLIWVDEVAGDRLWAINPWDLNVIDKNGADIYVVGEEGQAIDEGDVDDGSTPSTDESTPSDLLFREPDDNGVDDPPVAVDDPVTARSGSSVPVQVTANDYDPDGEAVAVQSVDAPGHGSVEIGTASTVIYTPDTGYAGIDRFEYTIVDGNGTEASATVIVELLPTDDTNKPPVGNPDEAQTGPGAAVVVEVLLNDIDPERDGLRIGSFTPPSGSDASRIGEVTETEGPSGLPALRYVPAPGFEGTARFSYRPVDALDGEGDDVEVRVEVADTAEGNRPPIARPDALRVRRNVATPLPVLVNDVDPDGDDLSLAIVEPLPDGLEVFTEGARLSVVACAGAGGLLAFQYEISDGRGGTARGSVLVSVIGDDIPNLPPVLTPDSDTVVIGKSVGIDVLANDLDPDGDPLVIVGITQPDNGLGQVVLARNSLQFTPNPIGERDETNTRFTYTVSDGNGHEVTADVNVSVLREFVNRPPYAQDDSTFTFVDTPVTIDVLRNDGDPSGERPTIVGTPGCATGGRAVVTADGQVRFDPPTGQFGAFRCTYEVTNSQGLRADASIFVSVREPLRTNVAPVATVDNLEVPVGGVGAVDVTLNDIDPDGDSSTLTVVSSTTPLLGTAVRRNNTITFTAGSTPGVTTINYDVTDEDGGTSLGRLVVRIDEPVNNPPVAVADAKTIVAPGVPTAFDVLANDSDPDEVTAGLTIVSASRTSGEGSVSQSGRIVTITPNSGFVGDVIVSYTIADSAGLTATSQATLTVLPPLNRAPVARDDSADVANGGTINTSVLFNDSDPDGDPLSIDLTSGPDPALGTARLNGDRTIGFTAAPGASGTAAIGYEISDGEFSADATLRIDVRPCSESAPVADDGFLETGYQQPVAVALNTLGSNGSIVDVVGPAGFDGSVYTPPAGENGNVSITYSVVNGCRQRASGSVTIDVNQEPITEPQTLTLGRNEIREIPVSNLATDDEALVIVSSNGAPPWVVTEPGRLVLQPTSATPVGTSTWTTVVRDPGGLVASVQISVTITNRAPVGVADTVDVSSGQATVQVLDNDTDVDSPNSDLRVTGVSTSELVFPEGGPGSVTIVGNRNLRIDPGTGRGTMTFTYTLSDQLASSAPVTVTVIGPAPNSPPFANDQSIDVVSGEPRSVRLDAGDADGEILRVVDLVDPDDVVVDQDDLTLTYLAPSPGTYVITYRVIDQLASSRTATVTITAT